MTVEPGPGFVARLREALRDAPAAPRVVIHTNHPPPLAGEGRVGALEEARAGVVTLAMSDTVKEVVEGRVRRTVPRETLVQVIGPWVFDREALAAALTRVAGGALQITDMIGFCEAAHVRVRVLPAG